jgi:hypothetical protein
MDTNLLIVLLMFAVGGIGTASAVFMYYKNTVSTGKAKKEIEDAVAAGKESDVTVTTATETAEAIDKDITKKLEEATKKEDEVKLEIEQKVNSLKELAAKKSMTPDEIRERYKAIGYDVEEF